MRCRFVLLFCCALLGVLAFHSPTAALNRFIIDGIHGNQYLDNTRVGPNLDSLYTDSRFTRFGVERLPLYEVLAAGVTSTGGIYDSILVNVPAGAHALYVILMDSTVVPWTPGTQFPYIAVECPDQSLVSGGYGFTHLDNPEPGSYIVRAGDWNTAYNYLIGTGPCVWEVYPADDYDAVLDFHVNIYSFWTGYPPPRSADDFTYLQAAMGQGAGIGLFYDCSEPQADKPIIRMRGMQAAGATVQIELPGPLTYVTPEPQRRQPLTWQIAPTTSEVELDYEVQFDRPLNFVWRDPSDNMVENRSWAMVRDLKLIEFVPGEGYRFVEVGTLAAGTKTALARNPALSAGAALDRLDRSMRRDAERGGLTTAEMNAFLARCQWPLRMLSRSGLEPGVMAIYHLDGADYDALLPLTTDPVPAERKRVLWIQSFLPERVTGPLPVHAPRAFSPPPSAQIEGEYHEYGVLHETYGGDELDDMDAWGWHFYDYYLIDTTDWGEPMPEYGPWGQHLFDTWGTGTLAAELHSGVTTVQGSFTGPIGADPADVLLSGDADTYCSASGDICPFPQGSFPPVIVGREDPSGACIIAAGDISFLTTLADNVQLGRNIFSALHGTHTENVPDIDIPTAVISLQLPLQGAGASEVWIYNRGDAQLNTDWFPPTADWVTVTGSFPRSIGPQDSVLFTLHWNSTNLAEGFYTDWWLITSDDPNEDSLFWPVRLQVGTAFAADPAPAPVPAAFRLAEPYPNPFNPTTQLSFALAHESRVRLELCNLLGQQVRLLTDARWSAGEHTLTLDLSGQAAGVYFVRGESAGTVAIRKLMLLK